METPEDILQKYWGHPQFRGLQASVIDAVLEHKDVLALMPTGGGKSVCFQVPALMRPGLCLVITPLIALMKDQVQQLTERGIKAACLYTGRSARETATIYADIIAQQYTFLYVSPERLTSDGFLNFLEEVELQLLVVDEAHCIAKWGYDFRPAYLQIGKLREIFAGLQVIALTASATKEVQADIISNLKLKKPAVFEQDFQRPNLVYQVMACGDKNEALLRLLSDPAIKLQTALVYVPSRKTAQNLAALLQSAGIQAGFYHAGLSQAERSDRQAAWMNNTVTVMVCTNAFGMGIDKADVRWVLHYGPTDCIENYYQEAGRAGRDGKKATAILLYESYDLVSLQQLPELRYPEFAVIQRFYQHIADYLQLPVGLGIERFFDFNITDFAKSFEWHPLQVHRILKTLEQAGLISFLEQIYLPAKVQIIRGRAEMQLFMETYPALESLVDYLMRHYEGIFIDFMTIHEKQIAWALYQPQPQIQQGLKFLHGQGLIRYLPARQNPQLYFMTNRASAEFLAFDHDRYQKQKKLFTWRLERMIAYMHTKDCRSSFLAGYFGQPASKPCGICDNCRVKP